MSGESEYLGKRIYDPEYGFGVIWAEKEDEIIIHLDRPTGEYTQLLVSKSALVMCRPTLHSSVEWKVEINEV